MELEIRNLTKTFEEKCVLSNVSLTVEKGDIFGVLGLSGAGKSTLVRCINGLETFDEGEIYFEGRLIQSPHKKISREDQRKIAMVFQSFNLLQQRTVLGNVELALEIDKSILKERIEMLKQEEALELNTSQSKKEIKRIFKERIKNAKHDIAFEALKTVGLEDKASSYPSQLSGGQQQRVAIARALVLKPSILLSDESTSALDPETTHSILSLLKQLNKDLGLTIIMISHQMNAIEEICNKVAIIDHSEIVECGTLSDVFLAPKADITKSLVYANHVNTSLSNSEFVRILFDGNTDEPLISDIVQDCQIQVSIVFADTRVEKDKVYGQTIIKRPTKEEDAQKLFKYLKLKGFNYEEVTK